MCPIHSNFNSLFTDECKSKGMKNAQYPVKNMFKLSHNEVCFISYQILQQDCILTIDSHVDFEKYSSSFGFIYVNIKYICNNCYRSMIQFNKNPKHSHVFCRFLNSCFSRYIVLNKNAKIITIVFFEKHKVLQVINKH